MSSERRLGELFRRPPTRDLEEVQKVDSTDDRAQAENDISEFIETESAKEVVARLTDRVKAPSSGGPRLLYLHATFGSGKSHLLKLVGLTTGQVPGCGDLAARLAEQFSSFKALRSAFEQSEVDRWVPVFLNLLDRDPAADPPLPYLIHLALCRRLGYPTEPVWLAEWAWRADRSAGLWDAIQGAEHEGVTFDDAVRERAPLRSWLRAVVPDLPGADEGGLSSQAEVTASIEEAERAVDPSGFDEQRLSERVGDARATFARRAGEDMDVELLLGLDEVALFVGDSERRFEEFRSTVEALGTGRRPLVIATGQWSLAGMARDFYGDVPSDWMREDEVQLEAADAEVIVRKRWLAKDPSHADEIEAVLDRLPDTVRGDPGGGTSTDPVECYPFLAGDLRHFRQATEAILTAGAETDREYVQGRALLVYVRGLFTDLGWASEPLGRVVAWDLLFDLLDTQGDYLPEWVAELLGLVGSSVEGDDELAARSVKALYLINQVAGGTLRGTSNEVARHLVGDVTDDLDDLTQRVVDVLAQLEDKHLVHPEETEGETVYRLVSREEVTVSQKILQQRVTSAQIRVRLEQWSQENEFCASEDRRREIDLDGAREVPLRTRYSVLSHSAGSSASAFDAVTLRLLVHHEDVTEAVSRWQAQHRDRGRGGEDVLAVVRLPEAFYERLDRAIAMQQVLERETRRIRELEAKARRERSDLQREFFELLSEAPLYRPGTEDPVGRFGSDLERLIADRVLPEKFPDRRVLEQGLRPLDDAEALDRFFDGAGTWPLGPEDATLLGVDREERALKPDGWVEEFFSRYAETDYVDGEELLNRIEGPGGDHLGTPFETLQALVLVAATGRRVTLRQQGKAVLDARTMGRMVRNKTALERITLRPVPPDDYAQSEEMEHLYETLTDDPAGDVSPAELLEKLGAWARDGVGRIREVDRSLRRGTVACARLTALEEALSPAESGEELREEDLADDQVLAQAREFALARRYFEGDLEDLWRELEDTAKVLEHSYASAPVARRIHRHIAQPGLPEPKTVRALLERAREARRERLTVLYEVLLKDTPAQASLDEANRALRRGLLEEADHLAEEVEALRDQLDRRFEVPVLREVLGRLGGADEEVSREVVESEELLAEARRIERARDLTRDSGEDGSLWRQFSTAVGKLEDDHPDSPLLRQCRRILDGTTLPEPERVQDLIEQAERQPGERVEEERDGELPSELMQQLEELDEGAMVAVIEEQS
jgi:hypothetical protein